MKSMVAFIIMLFFALVFLSSFLPAVYNSPYAKAVSIAGQAGLGAGIFLFFAFRGNKRVK